ncbi:MAG: outer membrane beta-barrel protein [Salinivirgaceae bacterium]
MHAPKYLRKIVLLWLAGFPLFLNAQHDRFIGGALFSLNGIGLLGETGPFWDSPKTKEGAGHGGISAGLFVKREFTQKIYAAFELRYSSKGSIYQYQNQYGSQQFESLYLDYLELPLLFGYKMKTEKRTYFLETGVAFARLMASKVEFNEEFYRTGTPTTSGFKKSDFIWIGSVKFSPVKKWKEHFLMGVSVSTSIIPINEYYKIYNLEYGLEFNYAFY